MAARSINVSGSEAARKKLKAEEVCSSIYTDHEKHTEARSRGASFSKYQCCLASLAFRKSILRASVPPCVVPSINDPFEKPLPDAAFDDEAVDRAVGHRHVPLIAVPGRRRSQGHRRRRGIRSRSGRMPPVSGRPPRTGRLHDGAAGESLPINLNANRSSLVYGHSGRDEKPKTSQRRFQIADF